MTFDEQTRRLTPDNGLWLTQKTVDDEKNRVITQLMYLGINDRPDNYIEQTNEYKEQWEVEHPHQEIN